MLSYKIMTSSKFFSMPNALHVQDQLYPTPAYFQVINRLIFWAGEILTMCIIELNSKEVRGLEKVLLRL